MTDIVHVAAPGRATHQQRQDILRLIDNVLLSEKLVLAGQNEAFAAELSAYLGVAHSIPVANGTDALEIALSAVGVPKRKTVLAVANAGGYSTTAILKVGATPVYVDIDPLSLQMSVDDLKRSLASLTERPAAIVVTHLFGKAADIVKIAEIADSHQIPLIEDCAQSLGATVNSKKLGSFGTMATTSFYPTKNLGALGDGGAIFTSSDELAEKATMLRQYGWSSKYHTRISGGRNSRLDEIQAAVLRFRLPLLDGQNHERREIFTRYKAVVSPHGSLAHDPAPDFVGHLAVLVCHDRERVQADFMNRGIATDIHYPVPDHLQPAHKKDLPTSLPVTERLAGQILSIPLFPELEEHEIQRVVEALGG